MRKNKLQLYYKREVDRLYCSNGRNEWLYGFKMYVITKN
jgi:hypothetical protein